MAYTYNPRIVQCHAGNVPTHRKYTEANTQTYLVGELVYLVSGAVTVCGTAATKILGIVHNAGSNVSSSNPLVTVEEIHPGDILQMRLTDNGSATTSASFTVGQTYGTYVASNVHYADLANNADEELQYIGPVPDKDGSATAWGLFMATPTACQTASGAS